MRRLILSNCFAASLLTLTAQTASAEPLTFQDVNGPGVAQSPHGGGATGQVRNVDLGDVTGTVCDCGEIEPAQTPAGPAAGPEGAGKGFPRYPLLALAAGPAICFTGICSRNPPPVVEPTPETPVPEPLTAATLAAGLGALAGLRARRRRRNP